MWRKIEQRIRKWRGVLITAPILAGLVIAATSGGFFQLLEWAVRDQLVRFRPREAVDPRIVIVTINEQDLNNIGKGQIPDGILANLIEKLKAQKPRVIGLDLYRNLPVPPGDKELIKAFKSTPNLIGIEKAVGETVGSSPILKELGQIANADLVLDADGKVRRGLLTVKSDEGNTQESIAVKLALMYLEKEGISLEVVDPDRKHYQLGKAIFTPFTGNEAGYVGADSGGYQILLNFRGTLENFRTISITDVLENRIPSGFLKDKILLVGATGQSSNDFFFTPYSSSFFTSPKRIPGVVIHANIISQIVSSALEGRPSIKSWTQPMEWVWILSWSFAGATVRWKLLQATRLKKNLSPIWANINVSLIPVGGILLTINYAAFLYGWWLPTVSPLLALTGSAIAIGGYHSLELQRKTRELEEEKADLEIMLETTTEHHNQVESVLQYRAEETKRESERKLSQFLDGMPIGVAVIDAMGRPYFANQKAQELLGKGVVPSATAEQLAEIYQNYIAGTNEVYPTEKLPIVQALHGERSTVDDIEIHLENKITPIEAWGTPIYDESGNIAYALVAFADITERKHAQEELKQAEEKYRRIYENALEGIFQSTPEGRYLSANPALAQIYGYDSPEELIETIVNIEHQLYVDPNRRNDFIRLMEQEGGVSGFEFEVYRKDGSIIWINQNARAVYDDNGVLLYYQGFSEDITERKRAETQRIEFTKQLYQLNKSNERFVPRQFLQLLNKESIVDVQLGDAVQQKMSILFADIRNFTTLSERMSIEDNFKFINAYLSRMEPGIIENNGFIDKYIGDAIMALFSGDPDNAVKAAIDMLKRLTEYNTTRTTPERPPIQIGIGINTGSLMLGTVGSPNRMDGSVISDAVNLAARLEGLTKYYGVSLLISHHTFLQLHHPLQYEFRIIDRVQVKGKSEMVSIFEIFDADPPEIKEAKIATKSIFEEAIFLYNMKLFSRATQLFKDCMDINPEDKVFQVYLIRCQEAQANESRSENG